MHAFDHFLGVIDAARVGHPCRQVGPDAPYQAHAVLRVVLRLGVGDGPHPEGRPEVLGVEALQDLLPHLLVGHAEHRGKDEIAGHVVAALAAVIDVEQVEAGFLGDKLRIDVLLELERFAQEPLRLLELADHLGAPAGQAQRHVALGVDLGDISAVVPTGSDPGIFLS